MIFYDVKKLLKIYRNLTKIPKLAIILRASIMELDEGTYKKVE